MLDLKILKREDNNEISLSSGVSATKSVGLGKLAQQVIKILLTSPGTDIWYMGIGGGLTKITSRIPIPETLKTIYSEIAISVKDTERYIMQEQIGQPLTNEETLKALDLISCEYDDKNNAYLITISILNMSNNVTTVRLG
jgi:hypothetical protein